MAQLLHAADQLFAHHDGEVWLSEFEEAATGAALSLADTRHPTQGFGAAEGGPTSPPEHGAGPPAPWRPNRQILPLPDLRMRRPPLPKSWPPQGYSHPHVHAEQHTMLTRVSHKPIGHCTCRQCALPLCKQATGKLHAEADPSLHYAPDLLAFHSLRANTGDTAAERPCPPPPISPKGYVPKSLLGPWPIPTSPWPIPTSPPVRSQWGYF